MGYSSAGTTELVARLENKRLIHRTRDPEDGRAFEVALTAKGEQALRAGLEAHIPRLETEVIAKLTPPNASVRRVCSPASIPARRNISPGARRPLPGVRERVALNATVMAADSSDL